jgi:uncharacterized RDD family membrane protein YckC
VALVASLVLINVGTALYNALAIGWCETTVGKHAVGLMVRAEDGSRAGYGRAFNRELVGRVLVETILTGGWIVYVFSGLAAAADRRRQSWHDKLGQTIVVEGRGQRRPRAAAAPDSVTPPTVSLEGVTEPG